MAAQSSLKNMALCLTAVCLICSAILGVVYAVTYDPIQAAAQKELVESISKVLPDGGELSDAIEATVGGQKAEYYVKSQAGEPAAYAVKSTTVGFGGPLTVMVGVLPDGTVYNTSVLVCNETPGLGAKCTSDEGFMNQWKNLGSDKVIKVKKDGGDIDAITASTITSRAYSLAVSNAVEFVKSLAGANKEEE
ncbi:MAG: RnfABCDGE type electron transport complex subunit G [Bacteroidia bacterium]|nr:RnfABCDGE type electron transport complex subunit G [Bacteroidia bacterium]